QENEGSVTLYSYDEYLLMHQNKRYSSDEVIISANDLSSGEEIKVINDFEGYSGGVVETDEEGFAEFSFKINEEGLYNILIDYFPVKGKGSEIVRSISIDGKVPFEEAREVAFTRIWKDSSPIGKDSQGNDVRPKQEEDPAWSSEFVRDLRGFYPEALSFFLTKGDHLIKIGSVKEPMAIGNIRLFRADSIPSYDEAKKSHESEGNTSPAGVSITVQGENAKWKSSSMIYPVFDRSSAGTQPSDPAVIKLNTIGGDKWKTARQWIEWTVDVPEAGLYKLSFRARQNILSGVYSSRKIIINGKVQFKEASAVKFPYSSDWRIVTPGDSEGDHLFYFNKGQNEIRLEVTLGDLADIQKRVNDLMYELNDIYRSILMITGPSPDIYRNYQFHKQIPDTITALREKSEQLLLLFNEYKEITGQNGEQAQILNKLYLQTKDMAEDPETIAGRFLSFKNNIVALGTWTLTTKEQPLEIDYLLVSSSGSDIPSANPGFWEQLVFSVKAFIASFSKDYDTVAGENSGGEPDITVWLGSGITGGRDQAQVLKKMIDNDFTREKGYGVDLKLVSMNALLTATIANKGPDVALSLSGSDPVNYAVRNAVVDLTDFPDYTEVTERFMPSSLVSLSFNGGIYGLPESQTFYMLFYRKDILEELSLETPDTWDDVITMLPVLQKRQLDFGLPRTIGDMVGMGFNAYVMFLYQNGGELYTGNGIESGIGTKASVDAFSRWTAFYTDYNVPREYDFINRFRVGEVPIGIADYNTYNYLSVFAPEIHGLWEFAEVPGTRREDGTIDRSLGGNVTACTIMTAARDKKIAWEFLKWWTDKDAQLEFGLELESIMGTAARYSPANISAFYEIPWAKKDFTMILK
ncbi:extracellular solute-binding protein, partial [Candidatus Nomurabacteria bacterium]|nr:extracellular solute-binding protein [Candidatus Nomurabacteria bacterium]